ncbi:Serine/threonine-protein kinase PknD [Pontiella desulfatans]|uniref:Serine/threonine-protein kinase PknD n=1 Tax=Pontiella desulfatans TaxID=2750659 RepID=A0A6C2TWN4_PONDE|nr:protein kinase [Pontiella desulfatans]VGO12095.1 Serine/threonine-protein kinase PknD [Pontiella desulfatans]
MDGSDQKWDADATVTLWQKSVPAGASSEDSIRTGYDTFSSVGKTKPRLRTLEPRAEDEPDFELGEKLGSGGMGVVYSANQTAFNREVAVKMLKPDRQASAAAADALMAEAVVTGHLEHPNVIPVYDLGVDAEGNLFYAMKEVHGAPWSKRMATRSLDENLDILLRVADTISFAHSRGILHRDLKPHNIMLGEFGEVMVMDWGASCSTEIGTGAQASDSSFCGTPAYMPPEMARGDLNRQGEGTDVYLLGAMLYQIISGHPPRLEKDAVLCINLASENHIDPLGQEGELVRIALKAMATLPTERFPHVRDFQQAIRNYRSHSESLLLLENAKVSLARARQEQDYDLFNRAIYAFREALELWPENEEAETLRLEAVLGYARCAFGNADFELAQSLLDSGNATHRELLELIAKAIRDRDAHKRRSKRFLLIAQILGGFLLLLFLLAFLLIRVEQRRTADQHRQGLANLISAYYGEQNHEATVATFWELHDQYGMDTLDPEALLDVRVAAAMNPWCGSIVTGINEPVGLARAAEMDCVWVVGGDRMAKVRIQPAQGYEPKSMVGIHEYCFGKRMAPGVVVDEVGLPFPPAGSAAMHEGADGTLWLASGSCIYHRIGNGWKVVLDAGKIDYPPLPATYNIERKQVEEWMGSAGRLQPITGIVLNHGQTHAAVALGNNTVGWFDLENKRCLGWLAVGHGTRYGELLDGGEPGDVELALSPDETRLAYKPPVRGESFVFSFELPSMRRDCYVYNRDYPIQSIAFAGGDDDVRGITMDGFVFSPDDEYRAAFSTFFKGPDAKNHVRWGRERADVRELHQSDIAFASFSPQGGQCCTLTEDGLLYVGGAGGEPGFELVRRIVDHDPAACLLMERRKVALLSSDGQVHVYDMQDYALSAVDLGGDVEALCRTPEAGRVYVLENDGQKKTVRNVTLRDSGAWSTDPLIDWDCSFICVDSNEKYLACLEGQTTAVFEVESHKLLHRFRVESGEPPSEAGFDATGRYFYIGAGIDAGWRKGMRLFSTATWEEILARPHGGKARSQFNDIVFDRCGGSTRFLFLHPSPKIFGSYSIGVDGQAPVENWSVDTGSTPTAIIPFLDPRTGEQSYWCQLWFKQFQQYDAGTGEASRFQTHWVRTGLRHPEFTASDPRVVFPMEDGRMQVALKQDLYPVFDPRALAPKIERAVLSTDATRLYLLSDGKLYCMQMPEAP